jgi:hypothetical protein
MVNGSHRITRCHPHLQEGTMRASDVWIAPVRNLSWVAALFAHR